MITPHHRYQASVFLVVMVMYVAPKPIEVVV